MDQTRFIVHEEFAGKRKPEDVNAAVFLSNAATLTKTAVQRDSLITEFQVSWDNHVASGCDFDCYNKIWPMP